MHQFAFAKVQKCRCFCRGRAFIWVPETATLVPEPITPITRVNPEGTSPGSVSSVLGFFSLTLTGNPFKLLNNLTTKKNDISELRIPKNKISAKKKFRQNAVFWAEVFCIPIPRGHCRPWKGGLGKSFPRAVLKEKKKPRPHTFQPKNKEKGILAGENIFEIFF